LRMMIDEGKALRPEAANGMDAASVLPFLRELLNNANQDVRKGCSDLFGSLYAKLGLSAVEALLKDLRPAQREIFEAEISKRNDSPRDSIVTVSKPEPKVQVKPPSYSAKDENAPPAKVEPAKVHDKLTPCCEFCLRRDPKFDDESALDMHWFRECPMLLHCPECSLVVEVRSIDEHLVEECAAAEDFVKCSKCFSAVAHSEKERHSRTQCQVIKDPSKEAMCRLCHKKVCPADDRGWADHLSTCSNNPRVIGMSK